MATQRIPLNVCLVTPDEALQIFRKTGGLLDGHFVLRSGRHSRQFFQCALALQEMAVVEKLGSALTERVHTLGAATVVAPAMGGLDIGQEVARQLVIRFIFVEKEGDALALRRGFEINANEKVLIVEDVVTQGGRVRETVDIVRKHNGNLVGVALIVDRSNGTVDLGAPTFSLLQMEVETFDPNNLPEDMKNSPPTHPGSK